MPRTSDFGTHNGASHGLSQAQNARPASQAATTCAGRASASTVRYRPVAGGRATAQRAGRSGPLECRLPPGSYESQNCSSIQSCRSCWLPCLLLAHLRLEILAEFLRAVLTTYVKASASVLSRILSQPQTHRSHVRAYRGVSMMLGRAGSGGEYHHRAPRRNQPVRCVHRLKHTR